MFVYEEVLHFIYDFIEFNQVLLLKNGTDHYQINSVFKIKYKTEVRNTTSEGLGNHIFCGTFENDGNCLQVYEEWLCGEEFRFWRAELKPVS